MRARLAILVAIVVIVAAPSPARASHHLWRFSQLYSNASGTEQFIQMVVGEDGEDQIGSVPITGGAQPFTFSTSLNKTTTSINKWILIATADFGGLPGGVTPDYVIPAHFLSTGGGTLSYGGGVDTWTYGALPVDGVSALHKSGAAVTTSANTPENFNLQSGSVNLASAVPTLPRAGLIALVGLLLFAGSGLLRRRRVKSA
jgi:hypothetical protein